MAYKWDIYLSYSYRDDQKDSRGGCWISTFRTALSNMLNNLTGDHFEICFADEAISISEDFRNGINNVQDSKILLVIGSPNYVKSDWARKELDEFLTFGDSTRIFVAEMWPLREGTHYPEPLSRTLGARFWDRDNVGAVFPLKQGQTRFKQEIAKLATAILDRIDALDDVRPIAGSDSRRDVERATLPGGPPAGAAHASEDKRPARSIFISYSTKDRERIRPLAESIERAGYRVWWDPKIRAGQRYRDRIAAQLDEADFIIVAWSTQSVQSHWVQEEAEEGKNRDRLIPVLIDRVRPPLGFRSFQTLNLVDWQADQEARLAELFDHLCAPD